ncbi:helix-turn-helix domain-containing protein [Streptosporangium longisporum]|uniref:Helix-turn-helix domain-containing protein n=1 Tax=Streptosporangium longisporum TaxID=46187 RepID=A0ABN3YB42_9ACTN
MTRPRTAARTVEHPELSEVSLQQVMEALADPVRRGVVSQLAGAGEDMSCGRFELPVSPSTLTHHFGVLREAGVIRQYYVGATKMNALRAEEMEERFPGLLPALLAASAAEPATATATA